MAISDASFRVGVLSVGAVLVASITALRFCGSLSLPDKPPPPAGPSGTQGQLLQKSASAPSVYQDFVSRDAAQAGVRAPTLDELARVLPYRIDSARHVLEVGQPAIEIAGVRLRATHTADAIALEIANATDSDIAYEVTTLPTPNISGCNAARAVAFNAMTIGKGGSETRVECVWRDGMALAVTRVESIDLSPLSAWYVSQVPPSVVGIDPRVGRGHQGPATKEACSSVVSQAVRSGLDRGEIGWRDLVDFYARHRCQTYQFPSTYRAFKRDGERSIPASAGGM